MRSAVGNAVQAAAVRLGFARISRCRNAEIERLGLQFLRHLGVDHRAFYWIERLLRLAVPKRSIARGNARRAYDAGSQPTRSRQSNPKCGEMAGAARPG